MKKRISSIKKIFGIALAAVLISSMLIPGRIFAQETDPSEIEGTDISEMEKTAADPDAEADPPRRDETGDVSSDIPEDSDISGNDCVQGENSEGVDESSSPDLDGEKDESGPADDKGEQGGNGSPDGNSTEEDDGQQGDAVLPPAALPPRAVVMPMDPSDPLYAQMEQFLSLIADRFQIYTVAVVELTDPANPSDPSAWQPVNPESPVEVSLTIPEGYDAFRTVVAEIGQEEGAQTPSWSEITYSNVNGSAVFETDHSGLFVVAEEKQWAELPGSLDMTSKVDKLELTKAYPSESGVFPTSFKYSISVPATGDDSSVLLWGSVTALAFVALAAMIIIIIKRRK